MKKRILATLLGAALVASMALTGCGNNNSAASSSKSEAKTESKSETKEESKTETKEESKAESKEESKTESSCPAEYTIGYYKDAADDYYKAGYEVFCRLIEQDPDTAGWKVIDKVGQGTSQEQLAAVEDFITAGVDAIVVVQNSPQITEECIAKANAAGIPYFAATHAPAVPAGGELAGFVGYNFVQCGIYAGEDAIEYGVKKVVNIEGKLGQGTASAQSLGFLQAYENAGLDIGGTAEDVAVNKTSGGADLEIVQWASGDWQADPAKKVMADVITALGKDGFDGVYVQNDEMADGVLQAFEEAGLDPGDYWIGSSNGKEKSWKWVEEGRMTMDVNQTPSLEEDCLYQMVKANACGIEYKKYLNPYTLPYNGSNVADMTLIPYNVDSYMEIRDQIVTDINDDKFADATEDITWN